MEAEGEGRRQETREGTVTRGKKEREGLGEEGGSEGDEGVREMTGTARRQDATLR